MKHNIPVTLILITLFLATQLIGLSIINKDMRAVETETGEIQLNYSDTIIGERPEMSGMSTLVFIILGVAIGTIILLMLIKKNQVKIWKTWFFLSVFITIAITLGALFKSRILVLTAALFLASWKIFKPNPVIHNMTEPLIYTGIAIIFVPLLSPFVAVIMLLLISAYDIYAVWKSKHMVSMAKFQMDSKIFAGLLVPYKTAKKGAKSAGKKKTKIKTAKVKKMRAVKTNLAILGGGDVVFPLLFAGAIMQDAFIKGASKALALIQGSTISLFATISIAVLFLMSKKGKFYPAMPFITAGCLAGYVITMLI